MRTIAAFLLSAIVVGCGQTGLELGEASEAIIGGTPDPGDSPIMLLVSYPADHSTFDTCTASLISPTVVLTAAHCIDPLTHPGHEYGLFPGDDASMYTSANTLIPQLSNIKEAHAHPEYNRDPPFVADIGIAILEQPIAREPLPINRDPLDSSIIGKPARLVGYGQTKYGTYNAIRHAVDTVVDTLPGDDTVKVGDLEHRPCVGDSGGPALVDVNDETRIIGTDSYTDFAGCLEPAYYRRTDMYLPFIDKYAPPEPPPPPDTMDPEPKPTIPEEATCQMQPGRTNRGSSWGLALVLGIVWRKRRRIVTLNSPS